MEGKPHVFVLPSVPALVDLSEEKDHKAQTEYPPEHSPKAAISSAEPM